MSLNEALALVLNLAEGNALEHRDAIANDQHDEYVKQQEAFQQVADHIRLLKEVETE